MTANRKTVLITGSTDGVGRYVAERLARGRRVSCTAAIGRAARPWSRVITSQGATPFLAPTWWLAEVRALGDAVRREDDGLDVLVNNAGIGSSAAARERAPTRFGALRGELTRILPAHPAAVALLRTSETGAHRQRRLARPASDRFRGRDAHPPLGEGGRAFTRKADWRRSCSPSISRGELDGTGVARRIACIRATYIEGLDDGPTQRRHHARASTVDEGADSDPQPCDIRQRSKARPASFSDRRRVLHAQTRRPTTPMPADVFVH